MLNTERDSMRRINRDNILSDFSDVKTHKELVNV